MLPDIHRLPASRSLLKSLFFIAALTPFLVACGGGGGSAETNATAPAPEPTPGSVTPSAPPAVTPPTVTSPSVTPPTVTPPAAISGSLTVVNEAPKVMAARFLTQATFGPRMAEIDALNAVNNDFNAWLDTQIALPATLHSPADLGEKTHTRIHRINGWWEKVIQSDDQLRQRMAWALSQIFVLADTSCQLQAYSQSTYLYYDLLISGALGNFEDLLNNVSRNLGMGVYLTLRDSQKANASGIRPDENYAREVLQLFSIGLVQLNLDGSVRVDASGRPLPTYSQTDIEELSRALTGWSADFPSWDQARYSVDFSKPMASFDEIHDTGSKTFLEQTLPAGQSAEEDMSASMKIIFNHPNVGPFISNLLIQRLVTSNPRPEYIARVATVFNNNGNGVRGDLAAVAKAILLDEDARYGHAAVNPTAETFGKLREPLLKVTNLWRSFDANPAAYYYDKVENDFLQGPLRSPTVFNFYNPDFKPGGEIRDNGLVAPEFQITTGSTLTTGANALFAIAQDQWNQGAPIDVAEASSRMDNPDVAIDYLNLLLTAGGMSDAMKQMLKDYVVGTDLSDEETARDLIYLIVTSAEYSIQR